MPSPKWSVGLGRGTGPDRVVGARSQLRTELSAAQAFMEPVSWNLRWKE
jgi:hypothetical protein